MDVKLLGGDGEIGGNKILVEHKEIGRASCRERV
jgi:hypothetical protein